MPPLPPAEKLPLPAKKNVRDEWEQNKPEVEQQISDTFGTPWTIEIDPLTLYPYAEEGSFGNHSPGIMIFQYADHVPRPVCSV
ncbi:uncharacterized protein B0I36DRAFT_336993 [Microdochium trichocladiopsis]|uniref:Uncharacterized protein n=1 Tax=Microdochium trichocladiopsis TaxID=1682393 RepID=A0A9P8XSZ2_9PEZI|nr:uncharacterized protein B0I36DRAFT_336993 [Microdochium trichocladiopsis]KAH7016185.1 hypothetical protein B0I36DRAFT_336993 [Microdochium trichocladiopsis]